MSLRSIRSGAGPVGPSLKKELATPTYCRNGIVFMSVTLERTEERVDTALYFPYMKAPEDAWFTQILLYWDDAATIVPHLGRSTAILRNFTELGYCGLYGHSRR
jgi:hypothetical protein